MATNKMVEWGTMSEMTNVAGLKVLDTGIRRPIDEGTDWDDRMIDDFVVDEMSAEARGDIFEGYGECDPRFEDEDYIGNGNRALDDEARDYFRLMDGVEDESYDEDWSKVTCTACGDKFYQEELVRIPGYKDICGECAQDIANGSAAHKGAPKMRRLEVQEGLARGKKARNSKPPRREKDIVLED